MAKKIKVTIAYCDDVPVHFLEGKAKPAAFDSLIEAGYLAAYDRLEERDFIDYNELVDWLK